MNRIGIVLTFVLTAYSLARADPRSPDPRFSIASQQYGDDFQNLNHWSTELQHGGNVSTKYATMEIDVPAGCTVWFKPRLTGPLMIQYQATVISAGGKNDRISDLNCFWMARDPRAGEDIFSRPRSGKFSDYDPLFTYYVGFGGNTNTTTRFRRYIGQQDNRPLLPQNDLRATDDLIVPNEWHTIRLVACNGLIQYWHDDRRLFELNDSNPYTRGWFAIRTTANHMAVRQFRVWDLTPTGSAASQPSE